MTSATVGAWGRSPSPPAAGRCPSAPVGAWGRSPSPPEAGRSPSAPIDAWGRYPTPAPGIRHPRQTGARPIPSATGTGVPRLPPAYATCGVPVAVRSTRHLGPESLSPEPPLGRPLPAAGQHPIRDTGPWAHSYHRDSCHFPSRAGPTLPLCTTFSDPWLAHGSPPGSLGQQTQLERRHHHCRRGRCSNRASGPGPKPRPRTRSFHRFNLKATGATSRPWPLVRTAGRLGVKERCKGHAVS